MLVESKVAVITGAASGIGAATAKRYADHGAHVVVADVDEDGGRETVSAILDTGAKATFVPTDVTQADDVRGVIDTALEEYGGIDVLFNNAGIERPLVEFENYDEEAFDRVVSVNLRGGVPGRQVRDSGDARTRRRCDHQYVVNNRRLRDSRSRGYSGTKVESTG